jgi:hypothetical protein
MRNENRGHPRPTGTIEIRAGEGAMLTFEAASDPSLDAFFDAVVELLLEQVAATTTTNTDHEGVST